MPEYGFLMVEVPPPACVMVAGTLQAEQITFPEESVLATMLGSVHWRLQPLFPLNTRVCRATAPVSVRLLYPMLSITVVVFAVGS